MIQLRPIQPSDDARLASIIRGTLAEFGANHPGTVYYDDSTNHLSELFRREQSHYFVAELNDKVVGGGGIYPTDGLPVDTCELVKMYLLPEARGIGLGRMIIQKCMETARKSGYSRMYLETMPELKQALKVYEKFGFAYLDAPLGNSGHFGCKMFMGLQLDNAPEQQHSGF